MTKKVVKTTLVLDGLTPKLTVRFDDEDHEVHYITGEELAALQVVTLEEVRQGKVLGDVEEGIRVLAVCLPTVGEPRLRKAAAIQIKALADFLTPKVLGSKSGAT